MAGGNKKNEFKLFKKYVIHELLPVFIKKLGYKYKGIDPWEIWSLVNNDLIRQLNYYDDYYERGMQFISLRDKKFREFRLSNGFAQSANEALYAMARTYGVATTDPTQDKRVVEFCFNIPKEQYLKAGVDRRLVRRAMMNYLPPAIVNDKRLGGQASDWFNRVSPYKDKMLEFIDWISQSKDVQQCIDMDKVQQLVTNWPESGWHTPKVEKDYRYRLLRALSIGSFIKWVEEGGPRQAFLSG